MKEESNSLEVTPITQSLSNLVFIPSSHDFGTYSEKDIIYYGLQIKNLGATQTSGQVIVQGDVPFSCYSGCSFSLDPAESQIASIEFAPCEIPYMEQISYDANVYAGNAQATVEGVGKDETLGHNCQYN